MNAASERMLQHFAFDYLPVLLQEVSSACAGLAQHMATSLDSDDPVAEAEVTAGLRKLLESKDCFVRARVVIEKRGKTSASGS